MELIKIDTDHYVVVNKTIQPVNGYYYDSFINKIKSTNGAEYGEASHCWQITHSNIGHLYQDSILPLSLQEVKELIGEVDKFELFLDREIELGLSPKDIVERIKWYYQTYFKEDNKAKKYTEEDIRKTWEAGMRFIGEDKGSYGEFIQSLQPKTEWEVEIVDGKLKLK